MGPKRIRLAWVGSALALAVILVLAVLGTGRSRREGPDVQASREHGPAGAAGSHPEVAAPPAAADEGPSRLADGLNAPGGDVRSDLRIIDGIFIAYRSALRTGNPIGENAEITAALCGRNKLGFAFIPADNPAINRKGELCDRWGTPYFFHQASGERMELRSAGPDRKLWTADDEVLTP
jgi:hypothetical protein